VAEAQETIGDRPLLKKKSLYTFFHAWYNFYRHWLWVRVIQFPGVK
jgi:hypothetical protein